MPAASSWNWLKVERETALRVQASAAAERGRHGAGVGGGGDLVLPQDGGTGEEAGLGQEGAGAAGREGQEAALGVLPERGSCGVRV